ncbi:MAG: hypothetical protein JSU70_11280, partial [Phycisphaerales bacterium]
MNVKIANHHVLFLSACLCAAPMQLLHAGPSPRHKESIGAGDGVPVKEALDSSDAGANLLKANAWRPWQRGFERRGDIFICDNGADDQVQRGVSQTVVLNQTKPEPIVATAWSKAQDVGASRNSDYSLYLDLVYSDGTPLWGQVDTFSVGTHDWEKAEVLVFPAKPVKSVSFHMLLRRHAGEAWFRDPELRVIRPPVGACLFDGVAVSFKGSPREGFQVRDVAAETDFVAIERSALGLKLQCQRQQSTRATFFDVTISDTTGADRAITLVYAVPVGGKSCRWLQDPRSAVNAEPN